MGRPRLAQREKDRKFTIREVMIAVGCVSGATKDEVAAAIPKSNGDIGITTRALYYDIAASGPIKELTDAIAPLIKHTRREIRAVALAKVDDELEKLLGPAIDAIKESLLGGADAKTAAANGWDVIRQLRGAPSSTVKMQHEGVVTHRHELHVLPKATLQALGADIERDVALMGAAKQLSGTNEQIPPPITEQDRSAAINVDAN